MTRRARPALRLLLSAALLYGSGAQWLVVQGAAWAGMLAARSVRLTVAQAVTTTFDGAHPCRVCRLVKRGAGRDAAPSAVVPAPAADFALTSSAMLRPDERASGFVVADAPSFTSLPAAPPSPPPDRLLAA